MTSRYLYTRAVDEVLARLEDDQGVQDLAWYLADRLGSVRQQVQTDGTILNEINYDSFGNILNETDPAEGDRFKYTGREYDDLTGLYYYRARWYDATTGKFLSEDPLGFAAEDYNQTRYVMNGPTNWIAPSGLLTFSFILPELELSLPPWEIARIPAPGINFSASHSIHIGYDFATGDWSCAETFDLSTRKVIGWGALGGIEAGVMIASAPDADTLLCTTLKKRMLQHYGGIMEVSARWYMEMQDMCWI